MDDQPMTLSSGEHVLTSREVRTYGMVVPVSSEQLADAVDLSRAFTAYMNATPEQREQWAREETERRRAERESAVPVPLTLDALLAKLGWSREYAEHVVQPYCTCGDDIDGWTRCEHARDLGVDP